MIRSILSLERTLADPDSPFHDEANAQIVACTKHLPNIAFLLGRVSALSRLYTDVLENYQSEISGSPVSQIKKPLLCLTDAPEAAAAFSSSTLETTRPESPVVVEPAAEPAPAPTAASAPEPATAVTWGEWLFGKK